MCLGLATWNWTIYQAACPWRRLIHLLSVAINCHLFFTQRWDHVKISLSMLACQLELSSLYRFYLGDHIVDEVEGSFLHISRRHYFIADIRLPWLLHSFQRHICNVSWALWCRNYAIDVLIGNGQPMLSCSLYWYLSTSKRSFINEERQLHIPISMMKSIVSAVRNYTGLG